MKKTIMITMLVSAGFVSVAQRSTDSVYVGNLDSAKTQVVTRREDKDSSRSGLAKAIETGAIYDASSPHHNDLHEFTYLVAMRDYCNKTLLQMRSTEVVNEKLSKKLEKELLDARTKITSPKFKGLTIEHGLYEKFLKQISDRSWD